MKKYSSVLLLGILWSCNSDFFNEYPEDQLTQETFYKSDNDFEQAVNAAYLSLRVTYEYFFGLGDVASDDAYNWKGNNSFDLISINESNVSNNNGLLDTHWSSSYTTVSRCNIVLDRIEGAAVSSNLKQRITGEAKFLRALAYFNLVQVFGDVPLVVSEIKTASDAFSYGRTAKEEVLAFIESELSSAAALLPETHTTAHLGRATNLAAKSLLGKVYLSQHKYQKCSEILSEVVGSGKHALLDRYEDIFDADNAHNNEIIYAVQYARNMTPLQGSSFGNRVAPNEPVGRNIVNAGSGHGMFHMTDDLRGQFGAGDKRLNMIDSATSISQRKYFFTRKYFDPKMTRSQDAANDWIVLRYADVILMISEALNELNAGPESVRYLNMVRSRAGVDLVEANIVQESLREIIAEERRRELNCEGHRWFDLLRSGKLAEVMNLHFRNFQHDEHQVGINSRLDPHEAVFPVPNSQIFLNPDKIIQNQGY